MPSFCSFFDPKSVPRQNICSSVSLSLPVDRMKHCVDLEYRQPVASPSASTSLPVFPAFECVSVDSRGPSAGCVTIRQDQLKYIIPFKIPIMLLIQVLQKQWNHFTMKTFSGLTTRWQQCGTLSVGLGGPL